MADRRHPSLSVVCQCKLLDISRSGLYYQPIVLLGKDEEALTLMKLIDRQYLATPFYGARKIAAWLKSQGHRVNRKRVRRLMRIMGLKAIYRRPRTSVPVQGHTIYPYLLTGMRITWPNQVWAADITYVPMARGVPLPCSHHRMVQPVCALLEAVKHPGRRLLRRGSERGTQEGQTRDIQHRPGQPVHQRDLHRALAAARSQNQHGWEREL